MARGREEKLKDRWGILAGEEDCVAIGEMGLDKKGGVGRGILENGSGVARKKGKPLAVHCRGI